MITEAEIREAEEVLERYKRGKKNLDERLIDNEQWWKLRHWEQIRAKEGKEADESLRPTSAWLFNSLINKHADYMDNYPEANILAREESDKETASILSDIIPYIVEQNEYEKTYSDEAWQKIKMGTGIYGIFWDSSKENGLGDVAIRRCDPLRIYWEPGINDIQDSKNLFYLDIIDNEELKLLYPEHADAFKGSLIALNDYIQDDYVDKTGKSIVVDWYYKRTVQGDMGGIPVVKEVLHYCKFCNGKVLYASENDVTKESGWYEHGKYPFVFDTMFPTENSPFGFGYLDIMKDCQGYIDKMGGAILENTIASARPRYLSKDGSGINEEEFTDLTRDIVHYTGSPDDMKPIQPFSLSGIHYQVYQGKIEELKETSGNRDFSQGSTASGVTAASAIAALQEAGSKLSRDMIKASFRAHKAVTYMVLELIRQFYDAPRAFRITNREGQTNYVTFDNSGMKPQAVLVDFTQLMSERRPVYDIVVTAQKASPFTKISQNELAKEMYSLGFFNPQLADQALACLGMMMFDGKEEVMQKISRNGTMYKQMMQMKETINQMAAVIGKLTGDQRLSMALDAQNGATAGVSGRNRGVDGGNEKNVNTDDFGNLTRERENSTAGKARERAASASTPKGMI